MTISFDQIPGNLRIPGMRNEFALGRPPFAQSMQVLVVAPVATGATESTGTAKRPQDDVETA